MKRIYFILLTTIIITTSCVAPKATSTIVSCNYNEKKNQTEYMVFPYGSVSIPGKWKQGNYNQIAKQQFFKNSEDVSIAISFGSCEKYEFNHDNALKGFDFVQTFYEWDSEYFVNTYGFSKEMIETDSISNYIIWRIYGDYNNTSCDTYFLFGEKKGIANNFSITETDKWTTEQKIIFLKQL